MADVESASSSSTVVQQQASPTSTSHMSPIIPLIAADLQSSSSDQASVQMQQQSSSSAMSLSGRSTEGSSSSSAGNRLDLCSEPELKKVKLDHSVSGLGLHSGNSGNLSTGRTQREEKLESRLGGILCCAVCLDLPKTAMYQCQMGHLMCAACFTHLLADGRLRDQVATCPNCRVEISKSNASRNLAVEKAVSELPSECQYCCVEFPYKSLERHETYECQERPTHCKYHRIGCQWKGPNHETTAHEANCLHPHKSGYEVMAALEAYDLKLKEERKMYSTLIELLSYEKIIFNDLQFKPYRTDEFATKLFYETTRFSAFNHQWVVKARINNSQRDPHQSNDRQITYQLILKSKTNSPMSIHFFALKGPFSDMKVGTQIYKHDFTEQNTESEYYVLPLPDSSECNRLLSNKGINFRLLMFLLNK